MSFNRWNYVEGNPINRTDPTGQCWIMEDGDGRWYPDNSFQCHRSNAPEPPYMDGLTEGQLINFHESNDPPRENQVREENGSAAFGGAMLSKVYRAMCGDVDAWWNAGPKFDLETFVGILIIQEASFRWGHSEKEPEHMKNPFYGSGDDTYISSATLDRANYIAQVVATVTKYGDQSPDPSHQSYTCPAGTTGACVSGVLNWWAAQSETAQDWIRDYYHFIQEVTLDGSKRTSIDGRLDGHYKGGVGDVDVNRRSKNQRFWTIFSLARQYGFNALHNSSYAIQDGPVKFGNNTTMARELPNRGVQPGYNGTGRQTIYYYTADGWVVYTASQYGYWHNPDKLGSIIDMTDSSPSH
jgi:hypothetical protein